MKEPEHQPPRPGARRRAVIDVGTNSVKLLVGDLTPDGNVEPVWEASAQTRLGAGLYETHRLQPAAIERTVRSVVGFVREAAARGAEQVGVVATSAAREAVNPEDLRAAVQSATGLSLQVISGDQEAEWVYHGVVSDPGLRSPGILILDVGGGSSEAVVGQGLEIRFRQSFRLGTVRCLETLAPADPPTAADWQRCQAMIRCVVESEILPALGAQGLAATVGPELVGASGTATVLARLDRGVESYDRRALEGVVLDQEGLRRLRETLWSLPLAQRRQLPGMPAERADVMLTGVAIYESLVHALKAATLRVSLRGLRFGALRDLWRG